LEQDGTATFLAKSAEIASARMGGKGGMPGGFLAISANGNTPNTGIAWTLTPLFLDANSQVVEGILRAYDATNFDPIKNSDGTPRLKLLWDSTHINGNKFDHCKFCPPIVTDGKVFAPTYNGRVDVYGLAHAPSPKPTSASRLHRQRNR
jgi:outer membrane protein assembly factor BamB